MVHCSSPHSLDVRTAHPTSRENSMTQLIRAVRYGDSLTIITHIFTVKSNYDAWRDGAPDAPQFPLFVFSENETKDECLEEFKKSVKAHPFQDELDMYLVQTGGSLYYGLKQIEVQFVETLKEAFGWTEDVVISYPVSERFSNEQEPSTYEYPLKTPEQIVANILAGVLFPTKISRDLYNDHVAQMRSLR